MSLKPHALFVATALLLAACSPKQYPPAPPPPNSGAAAPAGAAIEPSSTATGDSSGWTSSYPYGSASSGTAGSTIAQPTAAQPVPGQPAYELATPPTTAAEPVQPPAAAPSPSLSAGSGETMSEGELMARATDAEGGPVTVYSSEEGEQSPFEAPWIKPGTTSAEYQADIEACYRFANSQMEHDMQIESDVAAARYDDDQGLGMSMLTQKLNLYDNKRRRTELISDCMEKAGYKRQ